MADLGALLGAAGVGGAIGRAIVRLELDTSKYSAELKAAQAETTVGANTMGSGLSKFSGLATSAFAAAGVAAVAFGAFSVKAAIDANNAHLALSNTFKNNALLADSSVAAFERQADSLRDLTGVDDEAIIRGQALLGQFKLTGAQVQELTPLIVDLSAKMGIDLEAAAKAVGKATEGNTGALARYIGTIEKGATPTETYANILEKLGRVQGFAAERAQAEPWRQLAAQFEELAEQVGQALLPVMQSIVPIITDVVNALGPLLDLVGKAAPVFRVFGEVLTTIISPLAKLATILPESGFTDDLARLKEQLQPTTERMIAFGRSVAEEATPAVKKFIPFLYQIGDAAKKGMGNQAQNEIKDFTVALSETAEQTKITRNEFMDATRVMQREARQLSDALKVISKEKWLNDEYVKFLSEQGPEWLIQFAKLTKDEQLKAQQAWEEATKRTDNANESLEKIVGTLKRLDNDTSRHTVIIDYQYINFDPSKPGMTGQQR